jgi:hypothetical protein
MEQTRCGNCHRIINPRLAWKEGDRFFCSEFCADAATFTPASVP